MHPNLPSDLCTLPRSYIQLISQIKDKRLPSYKMNFHQTPQVIHIHVDKPLTSDHLSLKTTCCTFGMILKLFIAFFSWAAVVSTATETGSRHHGNKSNLTPTQCHSHVAVETQRHVQTAICLCRPMPHICLSSLMYVWHGRWGWGGCREADYVQPYSLHWLVPVQCSLCCLSCLGGHIIIYIG